MRTHRGSIRYLLQRSHYMTEQPRDFRPYNQSWKFDRKCHSPALERWIARLREHADELEVWLNGGKK